MQNHLLYCAYGLPHIHECRYALLRLLSVYNLKPPASLSVTVYTDQPALFEAFEPYFSRFRMKQPPSTTGDPHKTKIDVLRDAAQTLSGNLLYCDTDTGLLQPLEPLFAEVQKGVLLLHEYEGVLNYPYNSATRKLRDLLREAPLTRNDRNIPVPDGMQLFNSGVIGLPTARKDLLNDIASLHAQLYLRIPGPVAEQFSVNFCFGEAGTIQTGSEYFFHYYNLQEFKLLLQEFFRKNEEESIPNLVKRIHPIDARTILQEKNRFRRMPLFRKWLSRIRGRSWSIKNYQKKI